MGRNAGIDAVADERERALGGRGITSRRVVKIRGRFAVKKELVVARLREEEVIHVRAFEHPAEVQAHAVEDETRLPVSVEVLAVAGGDGGGAAHDLADGHDEQRQHRHRSEQLDEREGARVHAWRTGGGRGAHRDKTSCGPGP